MLHKEPTGIRKVRRRKRKQQPKSVGFVNTVVDLCKPEAVCEVPDSSYKPFLLKGLISLTGKPEDQKQIQMLRDTGAAQSFIVADVLPLSEETSCGSSVLVQGLEMEIINVPLHRVHIESELVTGFVRVGVRHSLPVKGVTFILGNDLAGGKVMPLLEVLDKPDVFCEDDLSKTYPDVFPACVLTRAQSRKAGGVVNLADSFIAPIFAPEVPVTAVSEEQQQRVKSLGSDVKTDDLKLPVTREQIITLQKEDQSLAKCFDAVKSLGKSTIKERNAEYFVENELLMRKW